MLPAALTASDGLDGLHVLSVQQRLEGKATSATAGFNVPARYVVSERGVADLALEWAIRSCSKNSQSSLLATTITLTRNSKRVFDRSAFDYFLARMLAAKTLARCTTHHDASPLEVIRQNSQDTAAGPRVLPLCAW